MKYESVGPDFKAAVEAMQRRQATLDAVSSRVAVRQDGDPNRKRAVDEVKKFLSKKSLLKDPKTVKTYTCNQPIAQVFQPMPEALGRPAIIFVVPLNQPANLVCESRRRV